MVPLLVGSHAVHSLTWPEKLSAPNNRPPVIDSADRSPWG